MRSLLLIAVAVSGSSIPSKAAIATNRAPTVITSCSTIDGALLGQLPLTVELGGEAITFAEWTLPDEVSGDFVGFAASIPSDVSYTVKAGTDEFRSASPRWLNPHGVAGPRVHGIDRITFCRTTAQ
jgi:hypothetical protein